MTEDIFKIKPLDKHGAKVQLDGRKAFSPFNSAKHLKTANIPAECDQCVYRSIDAGGNGTVSYTHLTLPTNREV